MNRASASETYETPPPARRARARLPGRTMSRRTRCAGAEGHAHTDSWSAAEGELMTRKLAAEDERSAAKAARRRG